MPKVKKLFLSSFLLLCLTSCGGYKDKPKTLKLTKEEELKEFNAKEEDVFLSCAKNPDDVKLGVMDAKTLEKCIKPKHLAVIGQYLGAQDMDLYTLKYDTEIAIRKKIEDGELSPEDGRMLISRSVAEISTELQRRVLMRSQAYNMLAKNDNKQFGLNENYNDYSPQAGGDFASLKNEKMEYCQLYSDKSISCR